MVEQMKVVSRKEWGARKAKKGKRLKSEVSDLVVTWSDTDPCTSKEECSTRVREIQKNHMDQQGEADIRYNFLVGGDGSIFEGRGWGVSPKVAGKGQKELKDLNRNSIYVACIGPNDSIPNKTMMMALVNINTTGIKKKHISKDFRLTKLGGKDCQCYDSKMDREQVAEKSKKKERKVKSNSSVTK